MTNKPAFHEPSLFLSLGLLAVQPPDTAASRESCIEISCCENFGFYMAYGFLYNPSTMVTKTHSVFCRSW
jgi:hypothetical protein